MTGSATPSVPHGAAGFADVLRVRAFRVLYGAEVQSIVGDQLARIALTVLVFARTGSDFATAVTFGLTYLPAIIGGVALARVGDRLPRRTVMVGCDVVRFALFAAMSVPGLPLEAVAALLVVAVFVGPAFSASAVSSLASELTPPLFRVASGTRMMTNQVAQTAGFAAGGILVGWLGARQTLVVDAVTYLVSAIIIGVGLRTTGAARTPGAGPEAEERPPRRPFGITRVLRVDVLASVLRKRRPRTMLLLSMLAGLLVVPEGLAVPFAKSVDASSVELGLLLATVPLGGAVGVVLLLKIVPERSRHRTALVMALVAGVPLVLTIIGPHLVLAMACWFLSGVAAAFQVEVFVVLVGSVGDASRSQLVSVCGALLLAVQGIGPAVFGAVSAVLKPAGSVSLAGALSVLGAVVVLAPQLRHRHRTHGRHQRV